ncbi:Hsp20 family protein [Vibrio sp. ZSDZ34]|jgi:HSP20 family protein|uniref:Hsp20 family protein n=1 Tax=Vibrio gelatinilyticus TaxID=2893468 RepID=A0A9X2B032_9VIBR|nr:Hsp20 family protein [Vibrio gelatinilyticus]MCJ2378223.1 Hsp20 family protein [Vibrio gelatinilyticus]
MSLIPRDSWNDFSHMFDHAFPTMRPKWGSGVFSPKVDVLDKETAFEIIADLPGVDKKDISITYENGMLTLSASTLQSDEQTEIDKVIHKERYEGKMVRSFTLSDNVQPQDIYAEFTDGVLVVVVPKVEPTKSEPKHIEIS